MENITQFIGDLVLGFILWAAIATVAGTGLKKLSDLYEAIERHYRSKAVKRASERV